MDWKKAGWLALFLTLSGCGGKEGEEAKEDKAKQAVREAVTREFQYYKGARQNLGEAEKKSGERRAQEKELE